MRDRRPAHARCCRSRIETQGSRWEMVFHCAPSEPHTVGPMPGKSDGPTTAAPAPSPKMNAAAAVGGVGEVGQLLDADHQDVLGAAAADHVVGQGDAVAVARARGGDVERRALDAEPVGDHGGGRRGLVGVGHGGEDDRADLRRLQAGGGDRLAGGRLGHVDDRLVGGGEAPGDDAGALADPLVGGVDQVDDLGVGHHPLGPVAADAPDAGVLGAGRGGQDAAVGRCRCRHGLSLPWGVR